MPRHRGQTTRRSRKAGLPPGTLMHIGKPRTGTVKLSLIRYDVKSFEEKELMSVEEIAPPGDGRIVWLNISGIHDLDLIARLGARFSLHPLLLEDIVNTEQRPKYDDYGDHAAVVAKMLYPKDRTAQRLEIHSEQISLVYGSRFVLSFQENGGDVFAPIRERLRTGKGLIREAGADYLMYSLLDAIVDHYFAVLELLGEVMDRIEDRLLDDPAPDTLRDLYALRRELAFVRRSVWPLREVLSALGRGDSRLIAESTRTYVRDIHDHATQIIDTIETMRDIASEMMDIYLSSISNRMTAVMKVLTIIATIFMPLTFIAGIYGMNFRYMPELEWKYGYPLVLSVMAAIGLFMVWYFRKKRWL